MQPSQINQLKEAAADIRHELTVISEKLSVVIGLEDEDSIVLNSALRCVKNAERALTRIEMALKDATIS